MPKAKSILDQIKASPPPRAGARNWADAKEREDPSTLKEINIAVDAWLDGDEQMRAACPSISSFAKKLLPHAGVKNYGTMISYIRQRDERRRKN